MKNLFLVILIIAFVSIVECQKHSRIENTREKIFADLCREDKLSFRFVSSPKILKVKFQDELKIQVTVENSGDNDIGFIRDGLLRYFQISIEDQHGKDIDFSKQWEIYDAEEIVVVSSMYIVLQPGEKYVFDLWLPKQIVLKKGNYGMVIKRLLFEADRKTQFCAETNKTKLKIF
jgi:hypothetical protein